LTEEDSELEKLRAKRLAEMQRNISALKQTTTEESEKKETKNPREIVANLKNVQPHFE